MRGFSFNPDSKWFTVAWWCVMAVLALLAWLLWCSDAKAQSNPLVQVRHDSFTSYYDISRHNPAVVVYELQLSHFAGNVKVSGRHFKADTKLPRPRVMDSDFRNTGYVRGHLCSAGDRDSDKGWLKETYLTSNLVPMSMVTNSGPWKVIEDSCRAIAKAGHVLTVAKLPLYYDIERPSAVRNTSHVRNTISRGGQNFDIWVPDAFLCFAVCQNCGLRYSAMCFNGGTISSPWVLRFMNDPRVSVILLNVIGLWSREEYETITR